MVMMMVMKENTENWRLTFDINHERQYAVFFQECDRKSDGKFGDSGAVPC